MNFSRAMRNLVGLWLVCVTANMAFACGNNPPVAHISRTPAEQIIDNTTITIYVGQTLDLYGDRSTDSDGSVVAYEWLVPSGIIIDAGSTTSHYLKCHWQAVGDYVVKLRVKDNGNAWSPQVSITVHVVWLTISGRVTHNDGSGCSYVTMLGVSDVEWLGDGYYCARVQYGQNYLVIPITGHDWDHFFPSGRSYENITSNQTLQDYVLNKMQVISGHVTYDSYGLSAVAMLGWPGGGPPPITNYDGSYSGEVPYGWSGTVTPTLAGYTFSPVSTNYPAVTSNQTSNYTATLNTYAISGNTGVGEVTLNGLPGNPVSEPNSCYSVTVSYGWTGTVTPMKDGYTFSPANKQYPAPGVTSNQTQNYTATPIPVAISGYVLTAGGQGIDAVAITFSNGGGSTITEPNGYYHHAVDYGYSGTITPEKSGYDFDPNSQTITCAITDMSMSDFVSCDIFNQTKGLCYGSIGAALADASANDVIKVPQGEYHERITFSVSGVSLIGDPNDPNTTILDANELGSVVTFEFASKKSVLEGFTIRGGHAAKGGGVYCQGALPRIKNCIITENVADDQGGGLYIKSSIPKLTNTQITNNQAPAGGGLAAVGSYLRIEDCAFGGNDALDTSGGAMYEDGSCRLELKRCIFQGNFANVEGGAMYGFSGFIKATFFLDNSAELNGGAITGTLASLWSCFLSGNQVSTGQGAAMYDCGGDVIGCTITENSLSSATGGLKDCNGKIENSIIWNNGDGSTAELLNCSDPNYCCIQGWTGGGSHNITSDPKLATDGYHLEPNSPCINAGDPNYMFAKDEVDIDGQLRANAVCMSIGAIQGGKTIYVDAEAALGGTGVDWEHAYKYLQNALAIAVNGDQIWVAQGTYYPDEAEGGLVTNNDRAATFALREGVALYGGFQGTETEAQFEQRDPNAYLTILSGDIGTQGNDLDNTYHIVIGANQSIIDGFVITKARADVEYSHGNGGGIQCNSVSPVIANCTFTGNYAWYGGGLHSYMGNPMVTNCIFTGNIAKESGSSIYNELSASAFRNCQFFGNLDQGILPLINPDVTVDAVEPVWYSDPDDPNYGGTDITYETASIAYGNGTEYRVRWGVPADQPYKSGLGFTGIAPPAKTFSIINQPFEVGKLRHFNFPIYNAAKKVKLILDLGFSSPAGINQTFEFMLDINETPNLCDPQPDCADDHITFPVTYPVELIEIDGRIYTLNILGFGSDPSNLLDEFVSPEGGEREAKLWVVITTPPVYGAVKNVASDIAFDNCLFVGNRSDGQGGALSNWSCGEVLLNNCTLAYNSAYRCGGMFSHESNVEITNSILWGNIDDEVNSIEKQQLYKVNGSCTVDYSCLQDNDSGNNDYTGSNIIYTNPQFTEIPNDGGDGWGNSNDDYGDLRLQSSSPCIDQGSNAAVPVGITTDLDGKSRFVDVPGVLPDDSDAPPVDMGAYEYPLSCSVPHSSWDEEDKWYSLYPGYNSCAEVNDYSVLDGYHGDYPYPEYWAEFDGKCSGSESDAINNFNEDGCFDFIDNDESGLIEFKYKVKNACGSISDVLHIVIDVE